MPWKTPLAPGPQHTLDQLQGPVRRPTTPYAPLLEALQNHQAGTVFVLDKDLFVKNLRCARRGAAAGVSGIPSEHLRPTLENVGGVVLLHMVGSASPTPKPLSTETVRQTRGVQQPSPDQIRSLCSFTDIQLVSKLSRIDIILRQHRQRPRRLMCLPFSKPAPI